MKPLLIILISFFCSGVQAFTPAERYHDIAAKDEDVVVFDHMGNDGRNKIDIKKHSKHLRIHSESGEVLNIERGNFVLNNKEICQLRISDASIESALEYSVKYKRPIDPPICEVGKYNAGFPVKSEKTRIFHFEEGSPEPELRKYYQYYATMPITEIKDQKIYSELNGKKFWVDLEEMVAFKDFNIILSKKTKKKYWQDFLKNDRGFVKHYNELLDCNLKISINNTPSIHERMKKYAACTKLDNPKMIHYHYSASGTKKTHNGYTIIPELTLKSDTRTRPLDNVLGGEDLPNISDSEFFEYRPYNLPYIYSGEIEPLRVIVYLKSPSKSNNTNRIVFAYYDNAWHAFTADEEFPNPSR